MTRSIASAPTRKMLGSGTASDEWGGPDRGPWFRTPTLRFGHDISSCPALAAAAVACSVPIKGVETEHAVEAQKAPSESFDSKIDSNSSALLAEGRKIFRYDTFGSEAFWIGASRRPPSLQ